MFSLWSDRISEKLGKTNKDAASFWKVSNLLSKLWVVPLVLGVLLLIVAASASFFLNPNSVDSASASTGFESQQVRLSETIKGVFPVIALLLFMFSGFVMVIYSLATAILAFTLNDVLFGITILVFAPAGIAYKFWKAGRIMSGTPEPAKKEG